MANNKILRYGSKGSDVKSLQEQLNQNGFNLDVDGSFGPKTLEAVKQFQKKNNLAVDGIVGTNTYGALAKTKQKLNEGGADTSTDTGGETSSTASNLGFTFGDFKTQNEAVINELELAKKAYTDHYAKEFEYDLNSDALYQQYKDKYIQQGKMAMEDTIGQASAMTGGYGNSYAATVGNQAYQSYLGQLNDVVPELYQMAYDQYNQRGQDLLNQYSLAANEYERAYGMYSDDKAYAYQNYRDTIADNQWREQMDLTLDQFNFTKQQYEDSKFLSGGGGYVSSLDNGKPVTTPTVGSTEDLSGGETTVYTVDKNGNIVPSSNGEGFSATVIKDLDKYTTQAGQAKFINNLVQAGAITNAEGQAILGTYGVTPLHEHEFEMVNDGGTNWFWGIDRNGKVRDVETGTEYTLAELLKEFKKTMTNKEAKAKVKEIQKELGI